MRKEPTIAANTMLALILALPLAVGAGTVLADSDSEDDDSGGQGTDSGETLVAMLERQQEFSQTADAIEQAGLSETLEGQGPFTIFAPTDEAWDELPEDERERLMSEEGLSDLREILSYHVVPDEIRVADVEQMGSVTTIQGQPLEVRRDGDAVLVNDATISQPDVGAGNGVIHGIDAVLAPRTNQ